MNNTVISAKIRLTNDEEGVHEVPTGVLVRALEGMRMIRT